VGGTAYTIDTLRTDLARFAFLLTGEDAVRLFGGTSNDRPPIQSPNANRPGQA
jgi:hypothetical protein